MKPSTEKTIIDFAAQQASDKEKEVVMALVDAAIGMVKDVNRIANALEVIAKNTTKPTL